MSEYIGQQKPLQSKSKHGSIVMATYYGCEYLAILATFVLYD